MNDAAFVKIAKALADPTRRLILRKLRAAGDLTCSCVCALANLSQPTISHHIGILQDAGIIEVRKKGQFHILTVNERALTQFAQAVAPPKRKRTSKSAAQGQTARR